MQTIQEALKKVNIVLTHEKPAVVAPAVAPQIEVTPTPPVIIDVKPPEASSTPEGTPPAPSGGIPAVSPDAHASVEDEQTEIQESEVPEGLRKRFAKLTTKNKIALKEAEDARQKAEQLQLEIEAEKREKAFYQEMLLASAHNAPVAEKPVTDPVPPVAQPIVDRPPALEDFSDSPNQLQDFIQASINYGINKGMQTVIAQVDPTVVEAKRKQETWKQQHPDFAQVMHDKNPALKILTDNPVTDQIIGRTKDNLDILYHYAKNPSDAQKLASMTDPIDVAMELASLKTRLTNNTQVEIVEPVVVAGNPAPGRVNPNEPPRVPNNGQLPNAPVHEPIKLHVTKAPEPYNPLQPGGNASLPSPDQIGVVSAGGTINVDDMMADPRYAHRFKRR
jgi:hypothetical protein